MELVKYEQEDFALLLEWFVKFNWTPCEEDCVPVNAYFAVKDGQKIAFSCFMATDSVIGFMGVTITDRDALNKEKIEAVDFLLQNIKEKATQQGFKYLYNFTETKAMVARFKRNGFKVKNRGTSYSIVADLCGSGTDFFEE